MLTSHFSREDWLDCHHHYEGSDHNCFYITDITAVFFSNITSIPIFCLSYANIIKITQITLISFICASIFEDRQITVYIGTCGFTMFIYIFRLCLCAYTIKKPIACGFTLLYKYIHT